MEANELRITDLENKNFEIIDIIDEFPSKYNKRRKTIRISLKLNNEEKTFCTSSKPIVDMIKRLKNDNRLPYNARIIEKPVLQTNHHYHTITAATRGGDNE